MKRILMLAALITILIYTPVYGKESSYEVHFIDTGQSDCILIRGGERNYLIDTGTSYAVSDTLKYLKIAGVKRIDTVFITHYHDDHYGGLKKLIEDIKVSRVILPQYREEITAYILELLNSKNIKSAFITNNYEINYGAIHLKALTPAGRDNRNENNNSTVLVGNIEDIKYVFLADIEKARELKLTNNEDIKNCDIVKIGHHGLYTSSCDKLLNQLNPKVAVLTCNGGESPSGEVVKRISQRGIALFRTDIHGNIIISKESDSEIRKAQDKGIEIHISKMLK